MSQRIGQEFVFPGGNAAMPLRWLQMHVAESVQRMWANDRHEKQRPEARRLKPVERDAL
jgi:hypothetical protein